MPAFRSPFVWVLLTIATGSCSEPLVEVHELVEVPEAAVARVLEQVLRELSSEGRERYVIPREYRTGCLDDIEWDEGTRRWQESLPDSLWEDFVSRSTCPGIITSENVLGTHFVFDPRDLANDPTPLERWDRFPGGTGLATLSPVGFSSDRTQALVCATEASWGSSSTGWLFHCTLCNGEWTVTRTVCLWLSMPPYYEPAAVSRPTR